MKRLILGLMITALVFFAFTPADLEAGKTKKYMGDVTTFLVGTSAVYDTIGTITIANYSIISGTVWVDWTSGGSAGGGGIYFEGTTDDGDVATASWSRIYLISYGDSCNLSNELTIPDTQGADMLLPFILVSPLALKSEVLGNVIDEAPIMLTDAQYLPFTKIRCIVEDTNWNAVADIYCWYLLKKD